MGNGFFCGGCLEEEDFLWARRGKLDTRGKSLEGTALTEDTAPATKIREKFATPQHGWCATSHEPNSMQKIKEAWSGSCRKNDFDFHHRNRDDSALFILKSALLGRLGMCTAAHSETWRWRR